MKWKKKGLVYSPSYNNDWKNNSALTPTAILLNKNLIRVYSSFRDSNGIGRIGFVDLNANNPSEILQVSENPVLDVGLLGMFDDHGVILGDVVRFEDKIYMYYVGFQLVKGVKFLAYTGLAISNDEGESFKRFKNTPVLDRAEEGLFIRAIHSVIYEGGKFKIWYSTGNGWEIIKGNPFPQYDINYIESMDGFQFPEKGIKCLINNKENFEYRIGRPRVYQLNSKFIMNFTYGTIDGRYIAGQASSIDGVTWLRNDDELGIEPSAFGWDSENVIYPSIVNTENKTYMFYNGNNFGKEGFGYAELMNN
jgi:hypothetical protein